MPRWHAGLGDHKQTSRRLRSAPQSPAKSSAALTIPLSCPAHAQVWVITGDKQETAINIAIACNLIRRPDSLLLCNAKSRDEAAARLDTLLAELKAHYAPLDPERHTRGTPACFWVSARGARARCAGLHAGRHAGRAGHELWAQARGWALRPETTGLKSWVLA